MVDAREPPVAPKRIGRYDILLPLGTGGMATVYLARAAGLGGFEREVAVKVTHPHLRESNEFADGLVEEAKVAVRIRHPNVVPVLDVGDDPYGVYLVMEYIEGESLSGLLRGRDMPRAVGLRILVDVLGGLHAAHELRTEDGASTGLVHRDFSPQNILVGVDGIARLTDFGIAKLSTRPGLTQSGTIKGKVSYMAPEQARGLGIDRRTDVWAAGVIAWEILAGRRCFAKGDELATLLQIISDEPLGLKARGVDVTDALDEAVASALDRDPARRPTTADDFRRRLEAAWCKQGPLADTEQVAGFVQEAVGAKLVERRERAKKIVALQRETASLSRLEAETQSMPAAMPTATIPSLAAEPTRATASVTVRDVPRRKRGGWPWAAAIAGVAVAGGATAWMTRDRPAAAVAAVTALAPSAVPVASSVLPPPPSSTDAPAPPPSVPLTVVATVPFVRLDVDGRTVTVTPASTMAQVTVSPDELAAGARVTARGADGRRASATAYGASSPLAVTFPAVRPSRPSPSPKPGGPPPLAPDSLKP
jgi:hypothetical protein